MQTQRRTFRLERRWLNKVCVPCRETRAGSKKSVTGQTMMKETMMLSQGHAKQLQMRNKHRLGTWNVLSVLQLGEDMMRSGVGICGLSEVTRDGQGHFTTLDGRTIVYSGRPTQDTSGVHRFIGKSLECWSDMNQSATESLLCDSTRNHETLGLL